MEDTLYRRAEQYRDRWSSYGSETGILNLSERLSPADLRNYDLFESYDDQFLETISPDVSVALWSANSLLFEEGSYVDLAFFVADGEVGVYLQKQNGRGRGRPIFASAAPDTRNVDEPTVSIYFDQTERPAARHDEVALLATMDVELPDATEIRLGRGEIFGEIGALSGWPQSVTARTLTNCVIVQIRVPALRQMKRKSHAFKDRIDALYRERSLLLQLQACPLFRQCSDTALAELGERARLVSCDPGEVVMEEGSPADTFYLVRSGFLQLSQAVGSGRVVVNYLSKGMTCGEVELLLPGRMRSTVTASSVGYSELVAIARDDFEAFVRQQPDVEAQLWEHAVRRIKEAGSRRVSPQQSEFLEFALSKGLVEGNSVLVIDLNVCTRCDDCVRACADTHGGRPRFIREGDKRGNLLIAKSCYHCQDPVCLIGCPTGAIRRANVGDVVEIKEPICIGCGTCASNCPYDAIVMHDTETVWPPNALPRNLRGLPRLVASKCDLCHTSTLGPACVRNCPHGCAFRIASVDEFERRQERREV
jgi:CRP-like cAMP-binding protein/Fe-S-cluster-containing dehydrogenase component